MQVRVAGNLVAELVDVANFRQFEVQIAFSQERLPEVAVALENMAELEGHSAAWVNADWLTTASGASFDWLVEFNKMVSYARTKGWVRDEPVRIRGHIVWLGDRL